MTENLLDNNNDEIVDPTKDYVAELVGDDKKFKTVADLARGKYEADLYIKTMERQKDELRNDYLALRKEHMAGAQLQDLIDKLDTTKQPLNSDNLKANDVKPETFDPKELDTLLDSKLESREKTRKAEENFKTVQSKLIESFGPGYKNQIKAQADSLGLTDDDVNTLARKSPTAFYKTFGLDQVKKNDNFQTPPNSSMRADPFAPKTDKRTWSYYQKMKQTQPEVYRNPKTQVQMHNDYISLGRDFEDGDFGVLMDR